MDEFSRNRSGWRKISELVARKFVKKDLGDDLKGEVVISTFFKQKKVIVAQRNNFLEFNCFEFFRINLNLV